MAARKKIGAQLEIHFPERGGARKGAGRKPVGLRPGVPHRERFRISGREPLHVTLKTVAGLLNLRLPNVYSGVKKAIAKACDRFGFRLVQFSVQRNHLHLIVEAADWRALSRGVKGLAIRVARSVNRTSNRRGQVFGDRYHARVLRTPLVVRNALVYVLQNARKHYLQDGRRMPADWIDPCSSGEWFDGWRRLPIPRADQGSRPPVMAPRTWLLRDGWRRRGAIGTGEMPATA